MPFKALAAARPSLRGCLKIARLMECPEKELENRVRELEATEMFARLRAAGVVAIAPYTNARFAAQGKAAFLHAVSNDGFPASLDEKMALLIRRIGMERFQQCFLEDEELDDAARATVCGISAEQARAVRECVDQLVIDAEFVGTPTGSEASAYSLVAGVAFEQNRPVLSFFHREIWKGRYRIEELKREAFLGALDPHDRRRAEQLLTNLELLERRKSTLYRVLEALLELQREYLRTGDPSTKRPLTQRTLASDLGIGPDVLNRLISNKAIRLPQGRDIRLRDLFPSAKAILLDRLQEIANAGPMLSDEALRSRLSRAHGAQLSRRSIAQYRKELGLERSGQRAGALA